MSKNSQINEEAFNVTKIFYYYKNDEKIEFFHREKNITIDSLNDFQIVSNYLANNETITQNNSVVLQPLSAILASSSSLSSSSNTKSDVSFNLILLATLFYSISIILCLIAIADLIFGLLSIPSTFITAFFLQYWPFSSFLCVFFNYMQNVSVTLTVYTLIWITLDKYWALVMPLKLRMSIRVCKYLMYLTWAFSLFISLPLGVFTELNYAAASNETANFSVIDDDNYKPQCIENWPSYLSSVSHAYNFSLLLIQYLIPLIILTFCYVKIGIVLKRTRAPGEINQNRDAKMMQSRKKLLKMSFFMVLTFMISWAPMQFFTLTRFFSDSLNTSIYLAEIFFVCHLFAVSSSYINPFIYALTNVRYRKGFKCIFGCAKKKTISEMLNESEIQKLTNFSRVSSVRHKFSKNIERI